MQSTSSIEEEGSNNSRALGAEAYRTHYPVSRLYRARYPKDIRIPCPPEEEEEGLHRISDHMHCASAGPPAKIPQDNLHGSSPPLWTSLPHINPYGVSNAVNIFMFLEHSMEAVTQAALLERQWDIASDSNTILSYTNTDAMMTKQRILPVVIWVGAAKTL